MKNVIETKVTERVKDELSPVDVESRFADMLDECYSFDSVGGPFAHMSPSRVLRECDETSYRCGVNDYADSLSKDGEIEYIASDWYNSKEVSDIRDEVESEMTTEAEGNE